MHGAFSYQLPEFISHTHDPEKYSKLSYGPILTGHIHNRSIYKNIIVPGSFDRLNHGDDGEDKGGYIITYDTNTHEYSFKFLINKNALEFYTFDIRDKTIEHIKKILNRYNKNKEVYIRFITFKNSKINESILELKKHYPNIHIAIKKEKQEEVKHNNNIKLTSYVINKE